jgi:hypothetical protein
MVMASAASEAAIHMKCSQILRALVYAPILNNIKANAFRADHPDPKRAYVEGDTLPIGSILGDSMIDGVVGWQVGRFASRSPVTNDSTVNILAATRGEAMTLPATGYDAGKAVIKLQAHQRTDNRNYARTSTLGTDYSFTSASE